MTNSVLTPEDEALFLDAYVDGELDAAEALRMERRLESDPALKAQYERLSALRGALRARVQRDTASGAFRQRIEAIGAPMSAPPVRSYPTLRSGNFDWRQLAASVAIAAVLGSAGTLIALRQVALSTAETTEIASLIAEHRRTLLAPSPIDVESSDRHTVKPWFDSKLALSPQVVDLASAGYSLAGGRVDVIGGRLVPAMIYRRHAHLISLVAIPKQGGSDDGKLTENTTQDGYTVQGWHGQDFDYYAVSDIAPDDLAAFVAACRVAVKS